MITADELCLKYKERGIRITSQRRMIFKVLENDRSHPSVEDVYLQVAEILPDVSLTTVYKILHELVEMEVIMLIEAGGKQRFDPARYGHAHFYCRACERLADIQGFTLNSLNDDGQKALAEYKNLLFDNQPVVFLGLCKECRI